MKLDRERQGGKGAKTDHEIVLLFHYELPTRKWWSKHSRSLMGDKGQGELGI